MTTPFLIILDGMTGAGKSTVARIIATHIPRLAVIGMDRVKRFVSDFERGERDNAIAKDIIFTLTQAYLGHDISVLIEEPFKSDEEVQQYDDLAHQRNIPIYKFQLYTTPELAFQRVVDRQKEAVNPVPEDRIRRNISLFTMREHEDFLKIDTSEIGSEEVARGYWRSWVYFNICITLGMTTVSNNLVLELHIPNFEQARSFYKLFGFYEIHYDPTSGGGSTLGYMVLKRDDEVGETHINFYGDHEKVAEHAHFKDFSADTPRGYGIEITIVVFDVEKLRDEVKDNLDQKHISQPLTLKRRGKKDFRVIDPFGFYVRFTEFVDWKR